MFVELIETRPISDVASVAASEVHGAMSHHGEEPSRDRPPRCGVAGAVFPDRDEGLLHSVLGAILIAADRLGNPEGAGREAVIEPREGFDTAGADLAHQLLVGDFGPQP